MMDIQELGRLVQGSMAEPPQKILDICGIQYRPYYHLLYLLARHTDGACVELGVEQGRGCGCMALANNKVWGVDNNLRLEAKLRAAETPGLHVVEASSLPPPLRIRETVGGDIAVLHVDTEHSYAQAREEFWAYKPLMRVPSVVCFDDTHAMENDVGRFILTLPWPTIFDDRLHECGYAVMVYDGERP